MSAPKQPAYPTSPQGDGDSRFTIGFVIDVAEVLARHGFPELETGADLLRLELALYRAIYGRDP